MKKISEWFWMVLEKLMPDERHLFTREDRENEMCFFHALAFLLCNLMFCIKVPGYEWVAYTARMWPIIGIGCVIHRLFNEAEYYRSSWWTEFVIACKVNDFFMTVFMWPLFLHRTFTKDKFRNSTFRDDLKNQVWQRKYRSIRASCGHDNAVSALRNIGNELVKDTIDQSEELRQLPANIAITAKTGAACGATAVVVATTPVAGAAEVPKTTNAIVEVSASGWVTGVAERPIDNKGDREDTTDLRHARLRTIVKSEPLDLKLFTEIEGVQLQEPHQDWFKQYYLSWMPQKDITLSAGRLAVAPLWMVPPPFLLETVNYPRLPYSFIGYGVEADMHHNNWRVIADVTGTTGLKFSDKEQFRRPEGHWRIEYGKSPSCVYSVSGQASEDFVRNSVDVCMHPAPWMDVKGLAYHSRDRSLEGHTTTVGSYIYAGTRPIRSLPQLEVHGQVDYQYRWEQPPSPWILTVGTRILFNKGRQSLTADYSYVPAHDENRGTGTLGVRFQTQF